jgi:hypothetical protein
MRRLSLLFIAMLFHAAASAQLQPSYQGLWWNAPAGSESGWGVNITHQGSTVFATWFTYGADGKGLWLVMPSMAGAPEYEEMDPYGYSYGGTMLRGWRYAGQVFRTTGPAWDSAAFDGSRVHADPVGVASFRFDSPDSGVFEYTLNGVSQSKAITRQQFGAMPACALGGAPGAEPNFQDLWWRAPAASESGWGLNIAHQGDIVFATWFTYGADGNGVWYVLPAGLKSAPRTYSGDLYRTTGPAFDASPWRPSAVDARAVGSATLTFSDADNGVFTYTLEGRTASKAITRQVYAAPKTVCHGSG